MFDLSQFSTGIVWGTITTATVGLSTQIGLNLLFCLLICDIPTRWVGHPEVHTMLQAVEWLKICAPAIAVCENVLGFGSSNAGSESPLQVFQKKATEAGYSMAVFHIDHGVFADLTRKRCATPPPPQTKKKQHVTE